MNRVEVFQQTYMEELTKAIENRPEEYGYPKEQVPTVVAKMIQAIR